MSETFRWQDGERLIVFGPDATAEVWQDADLLTTERGKAEIPKPVLASARAVHLVPGGQVPEAAAAVAGAVAGPRIVAWGGGRVIDAAKAIASARGGSVCAVPTTLSGAEMSSRHRRLPGNDDSPAVRPALVLADPCLMAGQPERPRRWSAMNAIGHAVQSLCSPGRNPVASMAAARSVGMLASGIERPGGDRELLAQGALLAGYAIGSTGLGFHHALCQTVVRACDASHAGVNAALLPVTAVELLRRFPIELAPLPIVLDAPPGRFTDRLAQLAGGVCLRDLGVPSERLGEIAAVAARRPEIAEMPDPPAARQLVELLESAW